MFHVEHETVGKYVNSGMFLIIDNEDDRGDDENNCIINYKIIAYEQRKKR